MGTTELLSAGGGGGVPWDCRPPLAGASLSSLLRLQFAPEVSDLRAMGAIDLDLSEFENPAPTRPPALTVPLVLSARSPSSLSAGDEELTDHAPPPRSKKRKLPYRADVVVEGRQYKGKRVSRGEAELDVEALGLHDANDGYADQEGRNGFSADDDDEVRSDFSDLRDDMEEEEDIELDAENAGEGRIVSSRAERLQAEEKTVAARLAQEEKKDIARARVVRKQKVSTIPTICTHVIGACSVCS